MGQRAELEDKQSVVCLGCSFESIEPNKKPGQKYPKRCPNCGRFAIDNQRQAARDARKAAQKEIKKRGNMRTCCSTFADERHNGMAHCPPLGVFNDEDRKVLASWLRARRDEIRPERVPIRLGVDLVKLLLKLVVEIEKSEKT